MQKGFGVSRELLKKRGYPLFSVNNFDECSYEQVEQTRSSDPNEDLQPDEIDPGSRNLHPR